MPTKILLADDNVTIEKVIALTFANQDVSLEAVTRGENALEKVRSYCPDIVLADVALPGLSGYDLSALIKEDPQHCHVPVVLLIGTFEQLDENKAHQARSDAQLAKPFDTQELIHTISSLLGTDLGQDPSEGVPMDRSSTAGAAPSALVSPRTRESFLGNERVLDLFESRMGVAGAGLQSAAKDTGLAFDPHSELSASQAAAVPPPGMESQVIPFPGAKDPIDSIQVQLDDEILDQIAARVLEKTSRDVIREVAWEVVPEMAESILRQYLEDKVPEKS